MLYYNQNFFESEVWQLASFRELKNLIPMPEVCPFCGTKLNSDNAEIDHIIPVSMGGKNEPDNLRYVCRRCNVTKADKHDRLFEYYLRLMNNKGMSDETSSKKVDYVLRNMSAADLGALEERVKLKDPAYNRLFAYAKAIAKINGQELPLEMQPSNDELADIMNSTMKAYEKYDVESEERIEINGNTFTYKKGFPIDQYAEILASYGEDEQDEIYSVYLDDEGRLVVY